jgi:hypothetical protein
VEVTTERLRTIAELIDRGELKNPYRCNPPFHRCARRAHDVGRPAVIGERQDRSRRQSRGRQPTRLNQSRSFNANPPSVTTLRTGESAETA